MPAEKAKAFIKSNKAELISLLFIGLIAAFFSLPVLSNGFIQGHDSLIQLASAAARIEAIRDGQLPVRWAEDLSFGFGNPSFILYYPLAGYLIAILYLLGLGLENSYELLLAFSLVTAPLFFYLWARQIFKKDIAVVASLFYGLSPYLFLDVYVRAHLGESLSLALIPLVFYFIERNFRNASLRNIIFGGIIYALFIQSHGIMGLIFSTLLVFYILLRSGFNFKKLLINLWILILGLVLSAYFWLPSFLEAKYINSNLFLGEWYKDHFISLRNIIYSKWGFGSNINESGGLSPQIGPIHALFVFSLLFFYLRKLKHQKDILFWLSVLIISIFMSTSLSLKFWENIHTLQRFQFPWRFIALSAFSSSILVGYFLSLNYKKIFKILAIFLLMILAIPMIKIPKNQSLGNDFFFSYAGTTTFHNEATTIWSEGDPFEFPENEIEIIGGNGEIKNLNKKSNIHTFEANGKSSLQILDNTTYFPGWRVEVDGAKVPIQFQDPNHRGLITFDVPKGRHIVKVAFGESPIRLLSDIISLLGFFLLISIILFKEWLGKFLKIKVY